MKELFDFDDQGEDTFSDINNAVIKIKSPVLNRIAEYSKRQVVLLKRIDEKMDRLLPLDSSDSGKTAARSSGPPAVGNGGGIDRGFGSSSLLPIETFGSIV